MLSLTPDMRSILGEARQAYVAITTGHGPHVTPELYAATDRDIWFFVAATTLKARTVSDGDRIGALVRSGGRALVLSGTARTYDVRSPTDVRRAVTDAQVARAVSGFLLRNAGDLAAFGRDAITGRLGRRLPPRRVLFRLRPTRAAILDGVTVTESAGDWPGQPADVAGVDALRGSVDAVVGWLAPDGPVALPARLDGDTAHVPPAAAALAALPAEAPACVVVDDYGEPGPAAKKGTLRRGTGRLAPDGTATLAVARTTEWDGVRTTTVR
jgi:hypothetical protein